MTPPSNTQHKFSNISHNSWAEHLPWQNKLRECFVVNIAFYHFKQDGVYMSGGAVGKWLTASVPGWAPLCLVGDKLSNISTILVVSSCKRIIVNRIWAHKTSWNIRMYIKICINHQLRKYHSAIPTLWEGNPRGGHWWFPKGPMVWKTISCHDVITQRFEGQWGLFLLNLPVQGFPK